MPVRAGSAPSPFRSRLEGEMMLDHPYKLSTILSASLIVGGLLFSLPGTAHGGGGGWPPGDESHHRHGGIIGEEGDGIVTLSSPQFVPPDSEIHRRFERYIRDRGRRHRRDYSVWVRIYRPAHPEASYEDYKAWQRRRVEWRRHRRQPWRIIKAIAIEYIKIKAGGRISDFLRSHRGQRLIREYNRAVKASERIHTARDVGRAIRRNGILWGGVAPVVRRNVRRWIDNRRRHISRSINKRNPIRRIVNVRTRVREELRPIGRYYRAASSVRRRVRTRK